MKFYGYKKCGTCRKAEKYLNESGISYDFIDITEQAPTKTELKKAMNMYGLKKLFNTSGVQYRELKIKDLLPTLSDNEAIDLLTANGRLVKRPMVFDGDKVSVAFKEDDFKSIWG